ncbi:MAG: hypothetical protein K0M48_01800 [Thiobacillus sp.]|nr:hypothetical protein [Thiobacillus sp.]
MIKTLAAAALLLMLAGCSAPLTAQPVAGKPSPVGPPPPPMPDDPIACAADVQQCPDGSYVSRNPANGCAFEACPDAGRP